MPVQEVADAMSENLVTVPTTATVTQAAKLMRDHDVGDVLVVDEGLLRGLLTDRDLVVRVLADEADPATTTAGDVCSSEVVTVRPGTSADDAVALLRQHALRRLPVLDEENRLVGIVSLGDFAVEDDPASALADVSAAPPNQ